MRATIETHETSNHLPPIQVMVSLGEEDMSIKVGCESELLEMVILLNKERLYNTQDNLLVCVCTSFLPWGGLELWKWPGGVEVKAIWVCFYACISMFNKFHQVSTLLLYRRVSDKCSISQPYTPLYTQTCVCSPFFFCLCHPNINLNQLCNNLPSVKRSAYWQEQLLSSDQINCRCWAPTRR